MIAFALAHRSHNPNREITLVDGLLALASADADR
jgi:hypothetical protein